MKRWMVGVAAGMAGMLGATLGAQGGRGGPVPTPFQGPAAKGTALVLGQVVDASSGQPVSGAAVALAAQGGAQARGGRGGPAPADIIGGMQSATSQSGLSIPNISFATAGANRVLTDAQGRFVFHDLPAGSYAVSVTGSGYVAGGYGQTRPNGPSRPLDLTDGQRTSDVHIRLWKYAVITGNVQDETGQPAVGVSVRALRKTVVNGRARMVLADRPSTTDDRGDFRLSALVPGDYVIAIPETQVTMPVQTVQAMTDSMMSGLSGRGSTSMLDFVVSGGPTPSPDGVRIGDNLLQSSDLRRLPAPTVDGHLGAYLSQYFPAALLPSQASVLSLRSGEERGGINMQMRLVATSTVTGTVVGPEGPMANAPVKLTPAGVDDAGIESGFESASTLTRTDGSFTLLAVPAGQYTARAAKMPRPGMPVGRGAAGGLAAMMLGDTSTAGQAVAVYAQTTVNVRGGDVTGLDLQLREGSRLSGRLEFVGAAPPPQPRQIQTITVTLTPIDGRVFPQPFPVGPQSGNAIDASLQFKTQGYPPGRYTATIAGQTPQGWLLKSVVVNGRDVTSSPLDLTAGDVEGAVVTFSDKAGQIAGTVRGIAAGGSATVVIFPFDYKSWIADGMSPRRLRQAPASQAGAYSAGGLFGQDYYVVAVDDMDLSDNLEPATFEALSRVATRVPLADGEKKTSVDLATVRIK